MPGTLVWLRRDLRLADQPALHAAAARGLPVYPVYLHAPEEEAPWSPGAASRWWLHHSLTAFAAQLEQAGSRLTIRVGPSLSALRDLIQETDADAVYWNRCYEPSAIRRDSVVKQVLGEMGISVISYNASLLREPWTVATGSGDPYRVFTPFWKACKAAGIESEPLPQPVFPNPEPLQPRRIPLDSIPLDSIPSVDLAGGLGNAVAASRVVDHPDPWPDSVALDALRLLPTIPWADGLRATWTPGAAGAHERLDDFLDCGIRQYHSGRDLPGQPYTSRLSPHLHFGEISPRQILWALRTRGMALDGGHAEHFVRELGWREFAYHLLYHFPETTSQPLNPRFTRFPWRQAPVDLQAWQRGRTGIPIVDAGMRELWETGWMHNRVRMIVGSLLTKNLRLHWLEGAHWFWDTLVDADLAANTLGWQWIAGSGADAAPYFRIFNPVLQGQRFDPDGAYVRRYLPALAKMPTASVHTPWTAPQSLLAGYPSSPIVDLKLSREEALAAYQQVRADNAVADPEPAKQRSL